MPINGVALASVGAGTLFVWSGIKGWSLTETIGDVISGKAPSSSLMYPLAIPGQSASASVGGGGTTSDLANLALSYQGHAYKYGGAPGMDGSKPWDCSSFANWCVSKTGRAIPGYGPGKYNGTVHGPPTGSWGIWPGLRRISRANVQAGDIIVWTLHMGIAVSNSDMVSALNPSDRTKRTPIDGFGNGPLIKYGRLA